MIGALIYLQLQTTRNRFVARLRRLKQPKYLVGAIVGGLYFYFYFFRWLFLPRHRAGQPNAFPAIPADPLLYESLGALILFVIVLLAWLIPNKRAALTFTEAEIAFLFPAPVSRRMLIHFKLLRSQLNIVMSVLFLTLISTRFRGQGMLLTHAAGWWVALSTLNLHFLGASFARTMLLDRGISNWRRRLLVLAAVLVGVSAVAFWAMRTIPEWQSAKTLNYDTLSQYAKELLVSGPLPYLLAPFRLVVRPYLASDWPGFFVAFGPAVLFLALHYWWVIRSNVAFEEASVEASQKLAERVAAVRAGNWQSTKAQKRKRAPFNLKPTGFPPIALLWKNLISAGNVFSSRLWIVFAAMLVGATFGLRQAASDSNWLAVVGAFLAVIGVWALLLGPQIMRQDFRQDLRHADILKLYPLPGWQIALGELLAPAVVLTAIQWLLLGVSVILFSRLGSDEVSPELVISLGVAGVMVIPFLNMISLLIPNAAVLLFPAWFQTGREGPHGIEATGQRLIFAIGQLAAFVVALMPSGAAFVVVLLLAKVIAGMLVAIPIAAAAAAGVLALEAGLGVLLLGRLFTRLDVSEEQTN